MSKYISKIPLGDIERISILPGDGRTLAQLKGSADFIMNGGFYDMLTGKPTGHLRVDGVVKAKTNWNCWGFRWDSGSDIRMDVVPDSGGKNYINGVELLTRDKGPKAKLSYNADVGGSRGRTAMGVTGESLILYCSQDGTTDGKTPEGLRDELAGLGCTHAIMLDGGGSSQCDFQGETINSSRRVHNYIAVWLKKEEKEDKPMSKKVVLDPGHGVETAGKRSPDGTYLEHEFNLDMAKRLKAQLERHGVSVTLTRSTEHDVTISERADVSNAIGPDLFVSLHSNASGEGWTDPDGYGIYTSVRGEAAERNKAARAILARAKQAGIQMWGGGLFHDGDDGKRDISVLWKTVAPAVLIEHGFHTNIHEVERLKTDAYRALLARVDAKGILDYLGIPWVEEPAESQGNGLVCPHCGGKLKIEKG